MQHILKGLSAVEIMNSISAANTAAATSGWIDAKGYEGLILILISVGIITGTVDFTFNDAINASGDSPAAIVPIEGNPAQVTTSNDDGVLVVSFDARAPRSHLRVIGTVGTGPALISYTMLGIKKY